MNPNVIRAVEDFKTHQTVRLEPRALKWRHPSKAARFQPGLVFVDREGNVVRDVYYGYSHVTDTINGGTVKIWRAYPEADKHADDPVLYRSPARAMRIAGRQAAKRNTIEGRNNWTPAWNIK